MPYKVNGVDINPLDSVNDYLIIQDYDDSGLLILAYNFEIDPDRLPSDRDITIISYNLSQIKSFATDGKNISLFCKNFTTTNSPVISTSSPGQSYKGAPKSKVETCNMVSNNPTAPSGDNRNPASGLQEDSAGDYMTGGKAGNIHVSLLSLEGELSLSSKGGKGGKGQNGANGNNGCDYPRPKWPEIDGMYYYPAESGGIGALGGWGGDGGQLTIVCEDHILLKQISVDSSGGEQGEYGDAGISGTSGGARFMIYFTGKYDKSGEPILATKGLLPTGPAPQTINPVKTNERRGRDGETFRSARDAYGKFIPVEFANLIMLKAESLYLNENAESLKECIEIFEFLNFLAENSAGSGLVGDKSNETKLIYLRDYTYDPVAWSIIKNKAKTYLSQIDFGLDLFGNSKNYAPNLNQGYLLNQYNKIYELTVGFEDYSIELLKSQEQIQVTQTIKDNLLSQYSALISSYEKNIDQYKELIISKNYEIEQRFIQIEKLKKQLLRDDNNFRNALRAQSEGCELEDIVHFLSAAVTIAVTVYTLGATAYAAAGAVGEVITSLEAIDSVGSLIVALQSDGVITKGINDVRKQMAAGEKALGELKNAYAELNEPPSVTPKSLIGIDKVEFDKVIDQFLNLPEAQKYKKDFHDFVDYVDLTNQKRKDFTSCILALSSEYQNWKNSILKSNNLKSEIFALNSEKIPFTIKQSIISLYYQTKQSVIKQIYLQKKAIQYQNPEAKPPSYLYSDYNLKTLNADIFLLNSKFIDSLQFHNYYETSNEDRPISVSFNESDLIFLNFVEGETDDTGQVVHAFDFTIKTPTTLEGIKKLRSIFTNIANIKVMGVKAILNSKDDIGEEIVFRLIHLGNSTITTKSNFQGPIAFTHLRLAANPLRSKLLKNGEAVIFSELDKMNLVGSEFATGAKCFSGVSPFANWRLEISKSENPDSDLPKLISQISNLNLYFWYSYENKI